MSNKKPQPSAASPWGEVRSQQAEQMPSSVGVFHRPPDDPGYHGLMDWAGGFLQDVGDFGYNAFVKPSVGSALRGMSQGQQMNRESGAFIGDPVARLLAGGVGALNERFAKGNPGFAQRHPMASDFLRYSAGEEFPAASPHESLTTPRGQDLWRTGLSPLGTFLFMKYGPQAMRMPAGKMAAAGVGATGVIQGLTNNPAVDYTGEPDTALGHALATLHTGRVAEPLVGLGMMFPGAVMGGKAVGRQIGKAFTREGLPAPAPAAPTAPTPNNPLPAAAPKSRFSTLELDEKPLDVEDVLGVSKKEPPAKPAAKGKPRKPRATKPKAKPTLPEGNEL